MAPESLIDGRSALVAYGSETGTAQDIAEELGRVTRRLKFTTRVIELNSISLSDLIRCDVVIIAISTTGQGDLPVNARLFWKKLRSVKLRQGSLANVCFTAFGIGDSSYANFNWASRKLSNRLLQLGARCFCDRGESDEQHPDGIDGLFFPWSATLRERLKDVFPLPAGVSAILDEDFILPEWKLEILPETINGYRDSPQQPVVNGTGHSAFDIFQKSAELPATLTSNTRLTPESHWQDVRLFEFATPYMHYSPGDVLTICPHNADEDVDELLKIMNWTLYADRSIDFTLDSTSPTISPSPPPLHLPPSTTLRALISHHLDLNAIPRRSFFSTIAHFTTDPLQKERLLDFTNPALIDELHDYTTRPRRSILEVLQEFDTVHIPWKWAASALPHIRERQFSIASGGHLKNGPDGQTRIQLLVAVVKYRTVIKKLRQGLCTRYLSSLPIGAALHVALSRSDMRLCPDKPAIMVGPGTGVAPLRAMMHERAATPHSALPPHTQSGPPPEQLLFYGARNQSADFFFAAEWASLESTQSLRVITAFSRDTPQKLYVQDRIREHSAAVFALLEMGALVYVCGSSGKMPQAVRAALVEVVERQGGVEREEAEGVVRGLERGGRYWQETW